MRETGTARCRCVAPTAMLIALLAASTAVAGKEFVYKEPSFPGPFPAEVKRVLEAYRMNLRILYGMEVGGSIRFRLMDVHTPSIYSDQPCEVPLGEQAKAFVEDFLRGGRIKLYEVRRGRDEWSWVGRLEVEGRDLSQALLERGFAKPWNDSWRDGRVRYWDCANDPPGYREDPLKYLPEGIRINENEP